VRNKMETKKIMATFAILMIALGVAGFAYAHWSAYLYVVGSIETGDVGVEWSIENFYDKEYEGKDVAELDVWIDQGGVLHIEISNAYPCYEFWIKLDVHGTGSVPAKYLGYQITELNDPQGILQFLDLDVDCDGLEQIHYCEEGYIYIYGHFLQEISNPDNGQPLTLPQGASASFEIGLEFANWNAP
jgi:hypothetical protein